MNKTLFPILLLGLLSALQATHEPEPISRNTALVLILLLFTIALGIIAFTIKSFKKNYSRQKMLVASLLLACLFVGAGVILYQVEKNNLLNKFYREIDIVAVQKVDQIVQWRHNNDLSLLINNNAQHQKRLIALVSNPEDITNKKMIANWITNYADHFDYDFVGILDKNANYLDTFVGQNITNSYETACAKVALGEKKSYLTNIYRIQNDSLQISLFIPFFGDGQDSLFAGVIHFRKSPQKFLLPLVASWPTDRKSAETLLYSVGKDSVFFASQLLFKKNSILTGISLKQTEKPVVKAALGQIGRMEGLDYRGIEVLAVSYKIPESEWGIVAKVDKSEYYTELHYLQFILISISLFLTLLGGFVMYLFVQIIKKKHLEQEVANQAKLNEMSADLAYSEQKYRLLFDSMPIGCSLHLMLVDQNGKAVDYRFLNLNPAFEKLTGLTNSAIKGKTLKEVLPESEYPFIDLYAPVALNGETLYFEQYSAGLKKHFEIFAYSPQPMMFVTMFNDISIRKEAEERIKNINTELEEKVKERTADLQFANKELEAFSYSVSHDLRAPLRSIEGFSAALYEDYYEQIDSIGKDYLNRVRNAAKHMAQLIDDFLNLSRISRQELELKEINLSTIFRETAARVAENFNERKIEFEIEADLIVKGDAGMITILVTQLINNAIKFTASKETALIKLERVKVNELDYFRVSDNGVGFDQNYVGKLFVPFQRLHSNAEYPGTGIGLAIAQRIIVKHGGIIFAEGRVGEGASFYFNI